MADEVDLLDESTEREKAWAITNAQRVASMIPIGEPGQCRHCDEDSPRLVGGLCAPCRDAFDKFRRGD